MNPKKTCPYCGHRFLPSRFHPDQTVCSSDECQRRRRTAYHHRKLEQDPAYKEQCWRSQKKWRDENPRYLSNRRREKRSQSLQSSVVIELERLLNLATNNRVLDLKSVPATVLLVCPKDPAAEKNTLAFEKNTFAHAQVIVLQGSLRTLLPKQP